MQKKFNLNKFDNILDIACNDGTFLEWFVKKKYKNVIGIEPAKNLRSLNLKKKISINTFFFNKKNSLIMKKKYNLFKVITANNVCAHTPNLQDFFNGIKNILDPTGVFIIEVSYLLDVYKKLTFDTIYHEHMSYHALKPLIDFVYKLNLEIFDFDLVKAQGGSIRIYISHQNVFKINKKKIKKQILIENRYKLFNKLTYLKYDLKIKKAKIQLKKILQKFKDKKYLIVGYGAPAKLTTFSHSLDINNCDLKYIIDDNELKQNKYSPGKKIPIYSFEKLNEDPPDVMLVLAWNFFESIHQKCKKTLDKKIIYINPFPKIKTYK